ncbi:amidohydrolase family protein [Gordonia sp. CPCC 206044]|uniref:amidohydrolase family protein n=1 Tax=Gordonia sp. CPCC 206044 TaxID=3140793 RepID=UPI003AF3B333
MPDSVVDAHVHLWDLTNPWYPGLQAMADDLGRPDLWPSFGLDEYAAAADGFPVERFVHVSAATAPRAYLDELRWVSGIAADRGADMRFIGTVDPTLPESDVLADLDTQLATTPHFRGARVLYDFAPDSPAARTVLHWLDDHELVFDLVTHPGTMDDWLRTLAGFPDLTVVLEHTGWPTGTDDTAWSQWQQAMTRCAEQSRARCKISGLGMTTMDLSPNTLRPWIEHAVSAFGWDRVMFGSNIPIEHMAGSYKQLRASLDDIVGESTSADQDRFYRDNAAAVYGFGE